MCSAMVLCDCCELLKLLTESMIQYLTFTRYFKIPSTVSWQPYLTLTTEVLLYLQNILWQVHLS